MDPLLQRFQSLVSGRYAIERELGRGGMATVYLAKDLRHDRQVAIKLLQPELTTAITAERFLREISITARLQHPNILTLIDSGAENGLAWFVMPHVEGESLRDRLMWEKQLEVDRAVKIAEEVASALAYAHSRGVVHRDIKPENILLSAGSAIVADFGIARAVSESGQRSITAIGLPLGTPPYMSPEQAQGLDDIDHRSDIYALGCVLFEMLAGRPPFLGPSVGRVIQQHLTEEPPWASVFRSTVPPDLDVLVARALAKDRARRFQTAEEMAEALRLIAAHTTLERATPGGSGALRVTPAKGVAAATGAPLGTRRLLVVAGVLGLVILAVVALFSLQGDRPRAPSPGELPGGAAAPEAYLSSIAILRPEVVGTSPQVTPLGPGIAAEIESQLRRIRGLRIISGASVQAVQDKGLTARQIADSLRVEHLVTGTVQSDGRSARVNLQLVDAAGDNVVWSKSFDQPLRDILMRQQAIAQEVAVALVDRVPGLRVAGTVTGSRNVDAVEAYTQGVELLARSDEESLDRSIGAFERALQVDPTYAAAAAGLAQALGIYVHLGYVRLRPDPYRTFAEAARWASRAVQLDANLPEAWGARAMTRLYTGAPPETALDDVERAIALAPASGQLRNQRGIVLARLGRYQEAVKESEIGAELDPLSGVTRTGSIAVTAIGARRYDVAQREAARALARDPEYQGSTIVLAVAYALGGNPARCLALDLGARFPEVHALCLELNGRAGDAEKTIAPVRDAYARGQYFGVYQLGFVAALYALRGETAPTIEWLERAYERSPTGFDFRFLDSGLFDRVREDPQYGRGVERIRQRIRARFVGGAGAP